MTKEIYFVETKVATHWCEIKESESISLEFAIGYYECMVDEVNDAGNLRISTRDIVSTKPLSEAWLIAWHMEDFRGKGKFHKELNAELEEMKEAGKI